MLFIVATTRQWIVSICTLIFWLMSEYQRESGYVVLLEWYWSICRKVTWIYPRNFFIIIMQIFPRCIVVEWLVAWLYIYLPRPTRCFLLTLKETSVILMKYCLFELNWSVRSYSQPTQKIFLEIILTLPKLFLNFPRNAIEVNISTLGCRWMTIGLSC